MERPVERVRGFHDVDAEAHRRLGTTLQHLLTTFAMAGFAQVDVPVLEQLDLYLRKNGAQVLSKIYSFVDAGRREVALRPEFTASIIRSLAPRVTVAGEALRVSYAGPVFRYEKPQRATARQFTQAGVEMLGREGAGADAEMVALACQCARAAGVVGLRLVLGHLAPIRALLAHLQIDSATEGFLLEHLEYFNRGVEQQQAVRRRLGLADEHEALQAEAVALPEALAAAVQDASPQEARRLVGAMLDQMGLDLTGSTRTPDEIIDRVLAKMRRQEALRTGALRDNLERALQVLQWLGSLHGDPDTVLRELETLLRRHDVPSRALDEVRQVLEALADHDLQGVTLALAPGMARGIAYYTGLMFELYGADVAGGAGGDAAALQVCGGGRYDGLARSLTGRQSFPALGFAFGVERLLHTIPSPASSPLSIPRIAVAFQDAAARGAAVRLAEALRREGVCSVLHDGAPPPLRALENLARLGYAAAVYLGAGQTDAMVRIFLPALLSDRVQSRLGALDGAHEAPSLVGTCP
jgi:histidyl-tRNA synthetase